MTAEKCSQSHLLASGSELQMVGPATENAGWPSAEYAVHVCTVPGLLTLARCCSSPVEWRPSKFMMMMMMMFVDARYIQLATVYTYSESRSAQAVHVIKP